VDTKAKRRLEIINNKLQALRLQLSGARKQNDEPGEVKALEKEIAALEAEAAKLKGT
jgi:polyhydroxyalkanoate synthesis regulator phasin